MQPKFIIVGNTPDDLDANAVFYLESRGFTIGLPTRWETKKEFCERVGISVRTFDRKMAKQKGRHVPSVRIEYGPDGNIVQIRATLEFETYMRRKR